MNDAEKDAIIEALAPLRERERQAGIVGGITIGVRNAYHVILDEAVSGFDKQASDAEAHYHRYEPALKKLRETWPELDPKKNNI